jgi:triphosphoribosyl-dephospho-CoA synthetase
MAGCCGKDEEEDIRRMAREAGLGEVVLTPKPGAVEILIDNNDPLYREVLEAAPAGMKVGDYVVSLSVSARKPRE